MRVWDTHCASASCVLLYTLFVQIPLNDVGFTSGGQSYCMLDLLLRETYTSEGAQEELKLVRSEACGP